MCLVEKNKLLVYGLSAANNRVFELHQFQNNSAINIESVRLLLTQSNDYIMHSCDYTGGSWFRATVAQEIHVFYDAQTDVFHIHNGVTETLKLVSVTNSKRGHYFIAHWNTASTTTENSQSLPATFWQKSGGNSFFHPGEVSLKWTRMNLFNGS